VTVQLGGSDQWGNITAGTELIRKVRGKRVYGVTFPLITRSDGKKFGKSEEGAIWLNADKLSPYDFYQYLYRTPDADVVKMLQMLTFLDSEEIKEISQPSSVPNRAQQRLATEVTRFVHGEQGLAEALKMTEHAKPGATTRLNRETLEVLAADTASIQLPKQEMMQTPLIDLLVRAEAVASKAEARRMVVNGGVYLNNEKVENVQLVIEPHHVIDGEFLLLGIGKKKKIVIRMQ
jgi:tyrosyl-tRNA synthetase